MAIRVKCGQCQSVFGVREEFAGRQGKCPRCQAAIQVPGTPGAPAAAAAAAEVAPPRTPAPAVSSRAAHLAAVDENPEAYDIAGRPKAKLPSRVATRASVDENVAAAVEKTRRTRTPRELLAAFGETIDPVPITWHYRIWIGIVAGFMILLPLAYLLIACLTMFGVYYHATHSYVIFGAAHWGRGGFIPVLVYVGPLIMGVAIVAFMFKPLFAKRGKGEECRALDPDKEPLLFAFVEGICASVGSPRPVRIEVDCEVNAGARLEGGVLSKDLVLKIGLPIVAGLELRQFAGVLAHEFGHFSQSTGMRLSYLIRSINMWFAQLVFERDAWDVKLEEWSNADNQLSFVPALARGGVWVSRRVLWALMYIGHAASGFLSRQMEYDADRYEARMVGSRTFVKTAWRLRELNLAENLAQSDIMQSWQQNRLPDNYAKLVVANVPPIPPEVLEKDRKASGQAKTGIFDTHPSDRDRIAMAKKEGNDGIFTLDGPATDVFRNFDSLSKLLTFELYKSLFGEQVTKEQLFPIAELVKNQAVEKEGYEAFQRFFLHAYSVGQTLPLPFDYPARAGNVDRAVQAIKQAREDMEAARDDAIEAWKQWKKIFGDTVEAELARSLMKAGCRIDAAAFELDAATTRAADEKLQRLARFSQKRLDRIAQFTGHAVTRITTALALLEVESFAQTIPDAALLREEVHALYPCVVHLGSRVTGETPAMYRANLVVNRLLGIYQQSKKQVDQQLTEAILRESANLHDLLDQFRWNVGDLVEYPFEHAEESITLGRFILAVVPPKDEIGLLLRASDDAVQRMVGTYGRALGRITHAAEEVERALGLEPIPSEPPPQAEEPEDDENDD